MSKKGFDKVWAETLKGIGATGCRISVAPDLASLLSVLYAQAIRRPIDRAELLDSIEALLQFLKSPAGQTHANHWAASNFLMPGDDDWEENWSDLPRDIVELLNPMGHEMWLAVDDPKWTENYGGLPVQLLERLQALRSTQAR